MDYYETNFRSLDPQLGRFFAKSPAATSGDDGDGSGAAIATADYGRKMANGTTTWKDHVSWGLAWVNVGLMKADEVQLLADPVTDVAEVVVGVITVGFDVYVSATDK